MTWLWRVCYRNRPCEQKSERPRVLVKRAHSVLQRVSTSSASHVTPSNLFDLCYLSIMYTSLLWSAAVALPYWNYKYVREENLPNLFRPVRVYRRCVPIFFFFLLLCVSLTSHSGGALIFILVYLLFGAAWKAVSRVAFDRLILCTVEEDRSNHVFAGSWVSEQTLVSSNIFILRVREEREVDLMKKGRTNWPPSLSPNNLRVRVSYISLVVIEGRVFKWTYCWLELNKDPPDRVNMLFSKDWI